MLTMMAFLFVGVMLHVVFPTPRRRGRRRTQPYGGVGITDGDDLSSADDAGDVGGDGGGSDCGGGDGGGDGGGGGGGD